MDMEGLNDLKCQTCIRPLEETGRVIDTLAETFVVCDNCLTYYVLETGWDGNGTGTVYVRPVYQDINALMARQNGTKPEEKIAQTLVQKIQDAKSVADLIASLKK